MKKRYSEEQIAFALRQTETGISVQEVIRKMGISERTFYNRKRKYGGLGAENYITITGTSRATATRDLQDLVQKGALTKTGEFKSTRYYLKMK